MAIVIICLLFSGIGIAGYAMMLVASVVEVFSRGPSSLGLLIVPIWLGVYAWLAFGMLCYGWVSERGIARHWSRAGPLTGLLCALIFNISALTVLPCMLLGIYLWVYHARWEPVGDVGQE